MTNARFTVTVGGIIFNHSGQVLLLKHVFRPGSGWGLPGGFLQPDEQPEEALRRELHEEVRLDIDEAKLFATRSFKKPRQIEIVFLCKTRDETSSKSFEVEVAGWFSLNSLPDGLPDDQKKLIKSAATGWSKSHD